MPDKKHYDVVIVGGGMVGLCLALAMKDFVSVALIEARAPQPLVQHPQDIRALALSYSTVQILKALGVWEKLQKKAHLLEEVHVSQQGRFGVTRLQAKEVGYTQLGAIVPAFFLAEILLAAVTECPDIDLIAPAIVEKIDFQEDVAHLVTSMQQQLSAHLVVIANGAQSALAKQLGISYTVKNSGQQALVTTVEVSSDQTHIAYERFIDEAILAFLPIDKNHYGVVWTAAENKIADLQQLSDKEYLEKLQAAFGYRLGRIKKISSRQTYPLQTAIAQKEVIERAVVLGNAAHTLHPAAGQGLNLALRRTAVLAEEIVRAKVQGQDIAHAERLAAYLSRTQQDARDVVRFTESLVHLFSDNASLLQSLRGLGLSLFDTVTPIKTHFVKKAMGVGINNAYLTQGISFAKELFL